MTKQLKGTVKQVLRAQNQYTDKDVGDYTKNRGQDENKRMIARDLLSINWIDFNGSSYDWFKGECQKEEIYQQHYLQGVYDGGAADDLYNANTKAQIEKQPIRKKGEDDSAALQKIMNRDFIRFAYKDDDGRLCAFGLIYNIANPKNWVLQIDRNTTSPLEQREAFLLVNGNLIPKIIPKQASELDLKTKQVPEAIANALHSKKIAELLEGIVDKNGKISIIKREQIQARLRNQKNIDNLDKKKLQVSALLKLADEYLPNNEAIRTLTIDTNMQIEESINFFKQDKYFIRLSGIAHKILQEVSRKDGYEIALQKLEELLAELNKAIEAEKTDNSGDEQNLALIAEQEKQIELFWAFIKNYLRLKQKVEQNTRHALFNQVQQVILETEGFFASTESKTNQDFKDLSSALELVSLVMDNPQNQHNLDELKKLSKQVAGKTNPALRNMGFALMVLIVAATILLITTGAFLALSPLSTVSAGMMLASSFGIGALTFFANKEQGVAKSLSKLKTVAGKENKSDPEEPNERSGLNRTP